MEVKLKKVLFYPSAYVMHTAYRSLLNNPPMGYEMVYEHNPQSPFEKFKKYKLLKMVYRRMVNFLGIDLSKRVIAEQKVSDDIDLVFSMGVIYKGAKPWVIDILDNPYCLAGYNYPLFIKTKNELEKKLIASNCKAIICANESSIDIMKKHFSKELLKKVCLIRPAIDMPKNIALPYTNKQTQILFMGSTTNPEDFYVKGGLETINAFEKIQKGNSNIKLVIRCAVPRSLIYRIKNNPQIILIENRLSDKELVQLYTGSSILLCPSHVYMLMSWLESMSYGLPIIALDTYAVADYLKNGVNGFIISKSERISYKDSSYPVNIRSSKFTKEIKDIDLRVITDLVTQIELLLKNKKLMANISKNNRDLIANKFSIEKRNNQLRLLFDSIFKHGGYYHEG